MRFLAQSLLAMAVAAVGPGLASGQNAVPLLINYQGELKSPSTGEAVGGWVLRNAFQDLRG